MKKYLAAVMFFGLLYITSDMTPDVEAQRSGGGSRPSFSSGSRSSASPSSGGRPSGNSKSSSSGGSKPSGGGKPSFSGGGNNTRKPSFSGGGSKSNGSGSKPKTTIDSKAAETQKRVESRQAMQKAEAPKPSYKVNGKEIKIDPKDQKIKNLRSQLSQERWANRELRQQQFYSVYASRPLVVYNDPYSSMFWYFLLDRSIEQQAMWAYCHKADMDAARYSALLARDTRLAAKVKQLEAEKAARDPNYVIPGMDPDLQYSDEYVDAVVNPQPAPRYSGWICLWTFIGLLVIVLIVYLVFVKEWN